MTEALTPNASTFVGRDEELARIAALLAEGHRIVTIWGTGGMGKTRIALEVARSFRPGAAFVVDLSEAKTAEGACVALAAALGIAVGPAHEEADLIAQVGRALHARRKALVILDNFEQLVPVALEPLLQLVAAAPAACFLVTSRERLRVRGEVAFELPPLSLPGAGARGSLSDAARLFLRRAEELGSTGIGADDPRLEQLLLHLEGIPLAIELAVARLDVLGLEGLIERMPDRLRLLSRGARDVPQRHTTMRAAVAWSWELLDARERDALCQLAVFRGGFTLDAAEHVLDLEPPSARLEVVSSLRDKSLLRITARDGSAQRFTLFESVRELALEELARTPKALPTRERHDAYYLRVGAGWALEVDRCGDVAACERLALELENLLDVHARSLDQKPPTSASIGRACRALAAADPVLATRTSSGVRRRLWEAAAHAAELAEVAPELHARVLGGLGRAQHAAGQLETSEVTLGRALGGARAAAARELELSLLLDLGVVAHARGDLTRARELYLEALGGEGQDRSQARALGNLAALDHDEGRFDAARASYQRSIAVAGAIGDLRVEGIMTTNLGVLEQEEERLERALACYERAIAILDRAGEVRLTAIARANLGALHLERGSIDEGRCALERALEVLREMGDAHSIGLTSSRLAIALTLSGKPAEARDRLEEARVEFLRMGDAVGARLLDLAAAFAGLDSEDGAAHARELILRSTLCEGSTRALVELSDDARTMVRILTRALDRALRGAPVEAEPDPGALVLGPDCEWFRAPGGAWRTVGDHRAAHRVLKLLVGEREARPGAGSALDALVAAGWPDEKIRPESAANRVYVVVAWLRKHGLGALLMRKDGGYLLDPSLALQRISRVPDGAAQEHPGAKLR